MNKNKIDVDTNNDLTNQNRLLKIENNRLRKEIERLNNISNVEAENRSFEAGWDDALDTVAQVARERRLQRQATPKTERFEGLRFDYIGTDNHTVTCGFCGCRTRGFGICCCEKGIKAQQKLLVTKRVCMTVCCIRKALIDSVWCVECAKNTKDNHESNNKE